MTHGSDVTRRRFLIATGAAALGGALAPFARAEFRPDPRAGGNEGKCPGRVSTRGIRIGSPRSSAALP